MEPGRAPDRRDETQAERDDRNLAELLQELRVAGLGVQVLFGFLLSLPFTTVFKQLDGSDRDLYLACLLLAAVATALLLGPVAYHRLGLDLAPDAYETFKHKQDECVKVVLKP